MSGIGRRKDALSISLAIFIFAILSIAAAITSQGFLEADACTHYLYARFAFAHPDLLINIWGRPICTAVYALPAMFGGRIGVRLMSLVLAIGCAFTAYRIAKGQGYRWPVLAFIFTLAQPLVFLHSFSELTELPFALMIGLAFWAYQRRQFLVMTLLIGFTPLSRPEGFGFLFLAGIVLILHRRWWWLAVLPLPLIIWSRVGWIMYGREGQWWMWLPNNWPYAAQSLYQPGSIFHFVMLMPVVASPLLFPFLCAGIWQSLHLHLLPLPPGEGRGEGVSENQTASDSERPLTLTLSQWERGRIQILIAVIPLLILVGHSALYALGKMASNGELRYMLVVAPFWGLLSAKGWEWLFDRMNWSHSLRWATLASLLPILANIYYPVVPLKTYEDWHSASRVAQWYQTSGIADSFPKLGVAHPAVYYFMDMPINGDPRSIDWRRETLLHVTPGTVLISDPVYSVFNSDEQRKVTLEDLAAAGWIDVTDRLPSFGKDWHVLISPTDASGRDAREIPHSPLNP